MRLISQSHYEFLGLKIQITQCRLIELKIKSIFPTTQDLILCYTKLDNQTDSILRDIRTIRPNHGEHGDFVPCDSNSSTGRSALHDELNIHDMALAFWIPQDQLQPKIIP
jgi:hypothetical protein